MKKRVFYIISIIILQILTIKPVFARVNIVQDSLIIGVNTTQELTVNSETQSISWASSNPNIVDVNNGIIIGLSSGTAYISATDGSSTDTCKITVLDYYIPVNNIILSKDSETLAINTTSKINVSVDPVNASNKKAYFISSNPQIVSVDSEGNIKANAIGTAYISITIENKTKTYKVNVVNSLNISLKSISIPKSLTIKEGETNKLNVTYSPSDATNKKITWKSSNTRVVTVDSSGNVKGVSTGSATITATSNDGNYIATCKITVTAVDKSLKSISLNKTELKLEMGKEETLIVNYNPTNAENKKVTWSSSNDEIVKVENGKIKALKPGNAEIKVVTEEGKKEAVCKVTVVSAPIESISFSDESISVYLGSITTLVTNSVPNNTTIENPIWTSSDEAIATVEDGKVTANKIGTTTITVSDESKKITASIEVNVIEKPEEQLLITIDGYDIDFNINTKNYTIIIGNETSLNINVNRDADKYIIGGNRDLKNGSIVTVTIDDNTRTTYVFNIKKKQSYTIYFIGIISLLLFINIIRLLIKNKKKK